MRWYTSATLFIPLCILIDRPLNLKCCFTCKTPKISFTENRVVLQQLSWAKRYFLTEERRHLVNRKHIPSAHSRLFVNGACQQWSRRGIPAPLLFLRNKVSWIYSYSKQCSHNRTLQETFMVLNASWRRHSTSDPWTVKATAGTYKTAEKRCLTSTLETGRWNGFTAYHGSENHRRGRLQQRFERSRCYLWHRACDIKCELVLEFFLIQLSHSGIFFVFPAVLNSIATAYLTAWRLYTTIKRSVCDRTLFSFNPLLCEVTKDAHKGLLKCRNKQTLCEKSEKNQDDVHLRETVLYSQNWDSTETGWL